MKERGLKTDPVTFVLVNNRIRSIAKEMAIAVERSARSPIIVLIHDMATAVLDWKSQLINHEEWIPLHSCGSSFAVKAVRKYFNDEFNPGDVIIVNDPYTYDGGSLHLPDFTVLAPVFFEGKLMVWTYVRGHQQDIGGAAPGTWNISAEDIHSEGLVVSPIKLYERDSLRQDVFDLIVANCRSKSATGGDVQSMAGAVRIGVKRVKELIQKYSPKVFEDAVEDILDYSERIMRKRISALKPGEYKSEQKFDGDFFGGPYTIRTKLAIKKDKMTIDFSDSDPPSRGFTNSPVSNTISVTYLAVMSVLGSDIERNEGCYRPLTIKSLPGTITHATYPAPVGACTSFPGVAIIDSVWKCFLSVAPKEVSSGWSYHIGGPRLSSSLPGSSEMFTFVPNCSRGGGGAIWGYDGWTGITPSVASGGERNIAIEMSELLYPVRFNILEINPGSAGAGRWRGGFGTVCEWEYKGSERGQITVYSDGFKVRPYGVLGGKPGTYSVMHVTQNGKKQIIDRKCSIRVEEGAVVFSTSSGGGGVGIPTERNPAVVLKDVLAGLITVREARDVYGVVIRNRTVDSDGTSKLRSELKSTIPPLIKP